MKDVKKTVITDKKESPKKRWRLLRSLVILAVIIIAGLGAAYGTINYLGSRTTTSRSLAEESEEQVSEPFNYSGYTEASYEEYEKTSQYVEMEDGTLIAVDVYLPVDTDGDAEDTGSYPVVFQFTPYGRSYCIPEEMAIIDQLKYFIAAGTTTNILDRANSHDTTYGSTDYIVQTLLSYGYAYVCADARGTGASYGVKIDFSEYFASDGAELVDWIAEQDWSDGNVGMFGGSYLGYTQLEIASEQPEALKAIFPEVVSFDGYSTEIRPGGAYVSLYSEEDIQTLYEYNYYLPDEYVYPTTPVIDEDGDGELWDEIPLDLDGDGSFLDDYNYPEDPDDEPQYADGNEREHIYYLATYEHLNNEPYNSIGELAEYIDSEITLGDGEYAITMTAYDASPVSGIADIMDSGIAVYNHGSWMDTFINGTTQLFCTMQSANPSKMIIDVGYHETYSPFWEYFGEDEEDSINAYGIELVRYFDYYLKGIDNGIADESPIYLYNMNGDGWRFEDEWPLERQVETDFYLDLYGTLSEEGSESGSEGSDDYQVDLTQDSSFESEWYDYGVSRWVMCEPDEVPIRNEQDEICLTYTTEALTEDTEVTGYPIVDLWVSSTSDDADFHIYLEDVDEEGSAVLVTEGVLRAGFAGLYDNDLSVNAGADGIEVLPELTWHGYEEDEYVSDIFADGEIVELYFELFATSWTFLEGHSIRISIACADTPTFETNSALSEDTVITVYRDEEHASKIILPIIPADSDSE